MSYANKPSNMLFAHLSFDWKSNLITDLEETQGLKDKVQIKTSTKRRYRTLMWIV